MIMGGKATSSEGGKAVMMMSSDFRERKGHDDDVERRQGHLVVSNGGKVPSVGRRGHDDDVE
jgi:hypothetical protein